MAFEQADLFELFINICNSKNEFKYTNYLIECLKLIFKHQNPSDLANSENDELFSLVEKEKDCEELNKIKSKEDIVRKLNKKQLNPRHSRFAGTYTALNMKALNDDNFQICHNHNSAKNFDDLLDDSSKKGKKQAKIYLLDAHKSRQRVVVSSVRKVLHHFCHDFLKRSYNRFMTNCGDLIKRQKLNDNEVTWFYSLAQFFMEFTRNLNNVDGLSAKYELVKSTFSIEMFHALEIYITRCIEMFRVEKKEVALWIKRMHKAVKLFKECLLLVKTFDNGEEEELALLVKNLKNQMFTISEFREFFTTIFKDFTKSNLNISLLRALIEANQVFLEIFEKQSMTLVEAPKEKKKYTIFDTYANEIFDALKSCDPVDSPPPPEDDDDENIFKLMNEKEFKMAVNLFKKKSDDDYSIIEKFDKLKEIYMKVEKGEGGVEEEQQRDYDDDNLLDFKKFLHRYTNPQILKLYINIFGEYETNSDSQTRCCLKMFKYLSETLDFSQIFYQLSLFNLINRFNRDPLRKFGDNRELYKEAIDIFRVILSKFFKRVKENSDLYLTLLFLKDGEYLDHEDGSDGVKKKRNNKTKGVRLNTKYDEKLIDLYCKYSRTEGGEECDENDILDKILKDLDLGEGDGSRKRISSRMVELSLFKSEEMIKLSKVNKKGRIEVEWDENDYQELKECFERLKEEKCEGKIVDSLKNCLNKNRKKEDIVLKLLEQNIISDKKELRKSRSRGGDDNKGRRKVRKQRSDDEEEGEDNNNPNIKSSEFVRSSADDTSSSSSSEEEQVMVVNGSKEEEEEEEESSSSNNNNKKRSILNRSPPSTINKPKRQRLILSDDE